MALMDFIKKQFIDVIHWTEESNEILAWRYPMQDMEIQNGAQLTVRESQLAAFVNEGTIADVFQPGRYKLATQTLPLLTNLKNWDKLFDSPFKSDVYFFATRQKLDRKWGTPNPVTIRDRDFGMVRLRAFGIYSYRLADPQLFHREVSGTLEVYTVDDLDGQLRNSMIGDLRRYTQFQTANAISIAAANEGGGLASMGANLAAGVGIGNQMAGAMLGALTPGGAPAAPTVAAAAPLPGTGSGGAGAAVDDIAATPEKLHALVGKGILSQTEFDTKKAELLARLV